MHYEEFTLQLEVVSASELLPETHGKALMEGAQNYSVHCLFLPAFPLVFCPDYGFDVWKYNSWMTGPLGTILDKS